MTKPVLKRPYLGSGWAFPIVPVRGRLQWAREEDDVEQAIGIILETALRERVMRPRFGAGLRRHVFSPNTPMVHRQLEVEVRTALTEWEPRITVESVRAAASLEQANVVELHIDYVVQRTNTRANRVYPFYLTEGS